MRVVRLSVVFFGLFAGVANAACDKRFDGVWGREDSADGQCAVMTFANDSKKNQFGAGTWTNLSSSCDYVGANKILEAEYDNKRHGNVSAKMISEDTCELTFGKAYVSVDTYGAWKPLSKRARFTIIDREIIEGCWENSGHDFGDCFMLYYSNPWN